MVVVNNGYRMEMDDIAKIFKQQDQVRDQEALSADSLEELEELVKKEAEKAKVKK